MTWRVAKALLALREQVDHLVPNRARGSDGTIGDESHQSRNSDHNPWVKDAAGVGVVTGMDITNDPAHGLSSEALAQALVASRDPRIKYVISNRKICASYPVGASPSWTWRPYSGANAHDHHCHISVLPEAASYDNEAAWALKLEIVPDLTQPKAPGVLREGMSGQEVRELTDRLLRMLTPASFDDVTKALVQVFQRRNGLVVDGIVGPATRKALGLP